MISDAWTAVKQDTNCFRKACFMAAEEDFSEIPDADGAETFNDVFHQLSAFLGSMPIEETLQTYVSIDDNVQA